MGKTAKLDAPTLAFRYLSGRNRGKSNYRRSDAAIDALILLLNPGQTVRIEDKKGIPCALRGKLFRLKFVPDEVDKQGRKKTRTNAGRNVNFYDLEEVIEP